MPNSSRSFVFVFTFAAVGLTEYVFNLNQPWAQDNTPSVPASQASEGDTSSFMDQFRLSYWGMYSGTTLDFHGHHPTPSGDVAGPVGSWNQLVLGYLATERLQVDAQMIFDWKMSGGQDLTLLNPRLGVSGVVYNKGNLSLWSNLNAELPTSESAIRDGLITSIGGFQELTWNIPQTKLSAILMNWARIYTYNNSSAGQTIAGGLMPTLRYNLSPKFKPFVTVETPYRLDRSANGGALATDSTMIRPGFSWDITPRINVMPYLILWPTGKMTADSSSFGMWLSGSIL